MAPGQFQRAADGVGQQRFTGVVWWKEDIPRAYFKELSSHRLSSVLLAFPGWQWWRGWSCGKETQEKLQAPWCASSKLTIGEFHWDMTDMTVWIQVHAWRPEWTARAKTSEMQIAVPFPIMASFGTGRLTTSMNRSQCLSRYSASRRIRVEYLLVQDRPSLLQFHTSQADWAWINMRPWDQNLEIPRMQGDRPPGFPFSFRDIGCLTSSWNRHYT
jgi:hypothetical protein